MVRSPTSDTFNKSLPELKTIICFNTIQVVFNIVFFSFPLGNRLHHQVARLHNFFVLFALCCVEKWQLQRRRKKRYCTRMIYLSNESNRCFVLICELNASRLIILVCWCFAKLCDIMCWMMSEQRHVQREKQLAWLAWAFLINNAHSFHIFCGD